MSFRGKGGGREVDESGGRGEKELDRKRGNRDD